MAHLTFVEWAFAAAIVLVALSIRGSAGFGGQAVAVPLLALMIPLPTALSVMVVLAVLSALGQLRRDWRKISWFEIRRLIPYSIAGVLLGLSLLESLDLAVLVRAFGVFVMLYGCF